MIRYEDWEDIGEGPRYKHLRISRLEVPGGWLVCLEEEKSITFYPDPQHQWSP